MREHSYHAWSFLLITLVDTMNFLVDKGATMNLCSLQMPHSSVVPAGRVKTKSSRDRSATTWCEWADA